MPGRLKRVCRALTPPLLWHGVRCLRSGAGLRNLLSPRREELIWAASAGLEVRPGTTDVLVVRQVLSEMPCLLSGGEPKCIIDGGANGGFSSAWFARRFPGAMIYALEPDAENFALLRRNTCHYSNVRPIQGALSNTVGEGRLVDSGGGEWAYALSSALGDAAATETHAVERERERERRA